MGGQRALNPLSDVLEAAPSIFALTRELHFWQVRVMSDPHSNIFKVARISGKRRTRSGLQYLCEWEGWGPEDDSWEPEANILDSRLIKDFVAE